MTTYSGASDIDKKAKWIKTARWIYWTLTILFAGTMFLAGITYLAGAAFNANALIHLGYPLYLLKILGMAKLFGSIAIIWGRFPVLKEWAYVGYSFNLMGAVVSHAFVGDSIGSILIPIIILFAVLISYRQWKTGWM